MAYCKRLGQASPWVHHMSFGVSPQGRELPLVIRSQECAFDPGSAAQSGKAIILVQSCIHANEPDGKDASLMLMRGIAVTRTRALWTKARDGAKKELEEARGKKQEVRRQKRER